MICDDYTRWLYKKMIRDDDTRWYGMMIRDTTCVYLSCTILHSLYLDNYVLCTFFSMITHTATYYLFVEACIKAAVRGRVWLLSAECWLTDWLTHSLIYWLTHPLTHLLIDWHTDSFTDCCLVLSSLSDYWLTHSLAHSLTDTLTHWLPDCLVFT